MNHRTAFVLLLAGPLVACRASGPAVVERGPERPRTLPVYDGASIRKATEGPTSILRRLLESHHEALCSCYWSERPAPRAFALSFSWDIASDGSIRNVTLLPSSSPHLYTAGCLRRQVESWSLPATFGPARVEGVVFSFERHGDDVACAYVPPPKPPPVREMLVY